ncbi:MAG: hypothetical protein AAF433_10115 [Bacteroidota bacterium]
MTTRIYLSIVSVLLSSTLWSQQVLPGDANDNGRVDQYDVLAIGYAYGHVGPTRAPGSSSQPQDILAFWPYAYPNGTNFIHADSDGNGRIELIDFAYLALNQGLEENEVEELEFSNFLGEGPELEFNNGNAIAPENMMGSLQIPIRVVSSADDLVINGLAFEIEVDPTYVVSATFNFSSEWINDGNMAFPYVSYEDNKIKVAISRLGINPVEGEGLLGVLNLIVVEDLIGILPAGGGPEIPFVGANNILAVDGEFQSTNVSSTGLGFWPLTSITSNPEPNSNNQLLATLSPNPVQDQLRVQSESSFTQVELIDLQGRQQLLYSGPPLNNWEGRLNQAPRAIYLLRLSGPEGQSLLRFIYSAE